MNIPLWSWHEPEFSLTEGRVDWGQSAYHNEPTIPKIKEAYAELKALLGTDQIIWCYTQENEYVDRPHLSKVCWKLLVPEENFFRIIDSYAWNKLLGQNCYPHSRYQEWKDEIEEEVDSNSEEYKDLLQQKITQYLSGETRQQIMDRLFIDSPYEKALADNDSISVILRHPIPESWVVESEYRNIKK